MLKSNDASTVRESNVSIIMIGTSDIGMFDVLDTSQLILLQTRVY